MPILFFIQRMKGLPKNNMMNKAVTKLAPARNEMYSKTPVPGTCKSTFNQ